MTSHHMSESVNVPLFGCLLGGCPFLSSPFFSFFCLSIIMQSEKKASKCYVVLICGEKKEHENACIGTSSSVVLTQYIRTGTMLPGNVLHYDKSHAQYVKG